MRLFLLDKSYDGSTLYNLKKRDIQYLEKVLRLKEGTVFTAKDSSENYYKATILSDGVLSLIPTTDIEDTLLDALSSYTGPFVPIDMYISILKGKRNETVVRALTEIGVRKITFISTRYTQESDFSSHQKERLVIIEKEAVQQCGGKSPILAGPINFEEAIKAAEGRKLILHQAQRGKTKSLNELFSEDKNLKKVVSCFIGPEGGFSDEECSFAEENDAIPVLLNTNILRAETSAVYTAAAIQAILQN